MPEIATGNTGDRSFDLSLRLLTALVIVALVGSVGLLAYRWIAPSLSQGGTGPISTNTRHPPAAPTTAVAGPSQGDQVLMDPGRVFRCEDQGRVSFSDRACPGGGASAETPTARPHPVPPAANH
jgi:hypothetical protein